MLPIQTYWKLVKIGQNPPSAVKKDNKRPSYKVEKQYLLYDLQQHPLYPKYILKKDKVWKEIGGVTSK